jgi:hypothetical protein
VWSISEMQKPTSDAHASIVGLPKSARSAQVVFSLDEKCAQLPQCRGPPRKRLGPTRLEGSAHRTD